MEYRWLWFSRCRDCQDKTASNTRTPTTPSFATLRINCRGFLALSVGTELSLVVISRGASGVVGVLER